MVHIATIKTDFPTKFGIPRQSGLVDSLCGIITFEPEYANPDALRGLEGFSHIWLLWEFSDAVRKHSATDADVWSPTVRPPRLGGNVRMGVFATRSPFRPNPIGLSCVKLESINLSSADGPQIMVSGVDLMDGTPILDIKPYIPYTDCRKDATGGFTNGIEGDSLTVNIPAEYSALLTPVQCNCLRKVLAEDPRPHYQDDPSRVYKFLYAGFEISFRVESTTLLVIAIVLAK